MGSNGRKTIKVIKRGCEKSALIIFALRNIVLVYGSLREVVLICGSFRKVGGNLLI